MQKLCTYIVTDGVQVDCKNAFFELVHLGFLMPSSTVLGSFNFFTPSPSVLRYMFTSALFLLVCLYFPAFVIYVLATVIGRQVHNNKYLISV